MSREIRFRAWNGLRMGVVLSLSLNDDGAFGVVVDFGDNSSEQVLADGLVLMQFTGLFDKNGTPIFEGDILAEGDSLFTVKWDQHWAKYKLQWHKFIQYPEWNRGIEMIVAGSIYSNPDLLK